MTKLDKNESKLEHHKKKLKTLNPPFLANDLDMKTVSRIDDRLPEMLRAVLIIWNVDRDVALSFFRYIAKFVENNQECCDITITGISKLPIEKRKELMEHMTNFSKEVNTILWNILLFPELPAYSEWKKYFTLSEEEKGWDRLFDSVRKTFFHQTQEATDCRRIKVLCSILSGKLKFPSSMEKKLRWVLEYPNYDNLKEVRPHIRSLEMMSVLEEKDNTWANYFWQYSFDNTNCFPEELVSMSSKDRKEIYDKENINNRKKELGGIIKLRAKLLDHFTDTDQSSSINYRHEWIFWIVLYALLIYSEIIFNNMSLSVTGRLALRWLVESYITLSYWLKKEKTETEVWQDYNNYGVGQTKLIYLKLKEMSNMPTCADIDVMDKIVNEDKRLEFVSINLGHWNSTNLRDMSIDLWLKETYDKYYDYTSWFTHGSRWAIREAAYQTCQNPLHRCHRIPTYSPQSLMPSVKQDAMTIMNDILELLSKAYPKFSERFTIHCP